MKAVLFSKNLEAYSQFINVCKSFFSDILFVSDSMSNIFEIRGLRHIRKNQPEYDNFIDTIYSFNGDILISFNYNAFIQQEILSFFDFAFNFHGSLLPNYSGPHAINWQIINGEVKTGVTIHELTPEIDGGNIVIQKEFELLDEYTAKDVLDKNIEISSKLLHDLIEGIKQKSLVPKKQKKLGNEFICKLRNYEDGEVSKGMSIKNIYDKARALADPWPGIFYYDEKGEKHMVNQKILMSEAEEIFKIINC
tara:strand:- start:787 stop:1539 length:753 start_codon:yes stop_codon:yes gene_type:complete